MSLLITDGRARLPLEMQAYYVWCGASSGRQFARSDDPDTRLRAYVRLDPLSRVNNEKFPALTRIAQDAARDIRLQLAAWEALENLR
ncbi:MULTISPECIES: hypothetical protein [unclassified Agrobacterium]